MAIMKIKGVVKNYAWGNKDFLPSLLGYEVSDKPQAEYWMGTHPSGEAVTEGKNLSDFLADGTSADGGGAMRNPA